MPRSTLSWALAALLLVLAALALLGTADAATVVGGHDSSAQRYRWRDSAAAACPGTTTTGPCPMGVSSWIELAGDYGSYTSCSGDMVCGTCPAGDPTGCPTNSLRGDEYNSGTCKELGFTFTFYGTDYTCVWINSNGFVKLSNPSAPVPSNLASDTVPSAAMPAAANEDGLVAGFWSDIEPNQCGESNVLGYGLQNSVWAKQVTIAEKAAYVIEYNGVLVRDANAGAVGCTVGPAPGAGCTPRCGYATFQIRLYEGTNNIDVLYQGRSNLLKGVAGTPNPLALGIENPAGSRGLSYTWIAGTSPFELVNHAIRYYPNHKPVAEAVPFDVFEDKGFQAITFAATDPDWDCINKVVIDMPTAKGTITPLGPPACPPAGGDRTTYAGSYSTGTLDFYGTDAFRYHVVDNVPPVASPGSSSPHLSSDIVDLHVNVQPVNDSPSFDLGGLVVEAHPGSLTTVTGFITNIQAGPSAPSPNEDGEQAVQFTVLPIDPSMFASGAGQPLVARAPTPSQGTFGTLTFVGSKPGTTKVCFFVQDNGGTANDGVDMFPLSPVERCQDITIKGGIGPGQEPLPAFTGTCGAPHAAFYVGDVSPLAGESVTFTDDASVDQTTAPTELVAWRWDFGDGRGSSERNPAHAFREPGVYIVSQTVYDAGGCSDTHSVQVDVRFLSSGPGVSDQALGGLFPDAGEDRTVGEGELVQLRGYNRAGVQEGVRYAWTATSFPPVFLINRTTSTPSFVAPPVLKGEAMEVRVSLVLYTQRAVSAEDVVVIRITSGANAPVAEAGPDRTAPRGSTVLLDATNSTDLDGDALRYRWIQVAGPTVALTPPDGPKVRFVVPPTATEPFEFRLNVSDERLSAQDTVRVYPVGASATPKGILSDLQGLGLGLGSDVAGRNWTWDLGDGTVAYGPTVSHAYRSPGSYTVRLAVVQADGSVLSYTLPITASRPTVAEPTPPSESAPGLAPVAVLLAALALAWSRRR